MRRAVSSDQAPVQGAYAAGVASDSHLFTAGQIGRDPASGELAAGTEAQLERIFERLSAICEAAGGTLGDTIGATVYSTDLGRDLEYLEAAFSTHFTDDPPARTSVGVAELPGGAHLEIDLVVALGPEA